MFFFSFFLLNKFVGNCPLCLIFLSVEFQQRITMDRLLLVTRGNKSRRGKKRSWMWVRICIYVRRWHVRKYLAFENTKHITSKLKHIRNKYIKWPRRIHTMVRWKSNKLLADLEAKLSSDLVVKLSQPRRPALLYIYILVSH